MWFKKSTIPLDTHLAIVEGYRQQVYQLQVSLAILTRQPLPAPLPPPSKRLWPSSTVLGTLGSPVTGRQVPIRVRGAEAVSVITKDLRREEELKSAIHREFKVPDYLAHPLPVPADQVPEQGKSVVGGFAPLASEPPPSPPPAPPSDTP